MDATEEKTRDDILNEEIEQEHKEAREKQNNEAKATTKTETEIAPCAEEKTESDAENSVNNADEEKKSDS